jgi:hypothetical protein
LGSEEFEDSAVDSQPVLIEKGLVLGDSSEDNEKADFLIRLLVLVVLIRSSARLDTSAVQQLSP